MVVVVAAGVQHPLDAATAVDGVAVAMQAVTLGVTPDLTVAILAMPMAPNHAAICRQPNKLPADQANARHGVMVAATVAATVVPHQHPHAAPAVNPTQCAPAST